MIAISGKGQVVAHTRKIIKLVRKGCTNRPFYHIVVAQRWRNRKGPVIEQLGTYDPLPNKHNEKLVSLNIERIQFWIGNGADTTQPIEQLLGLSGFYPVHPTSYIQAWRARRAAEENATKPAVAKSDADLNSA